MTDVHISMKRLHEASGFKKKKTIAEYLGVEPSTVTNWSARGVSKEGALAAADIFKTNANYILYGKASHEEVDIYQKIKIPVMNSITFGQHTDIKSDDSRICDWLIKEDHLSESAFGFLVVGRSMNPEFGVGDIAVIDVIDVSELKDGDYVLAQIIGGDHAVLKQVIFGESFADVHLMATNKQIPSSGIQHISRFNILGVVNYKITKYR